MKRVVVIGGGLVGLSAALECARRGHAVTVIEGAPDRRGASFGNAGFVSPSHVVPLAAPGMVALGLKWMGNPESPFYLRPRLDWDLARWAWLFWKACTPARVERAAPLLCDLLLASREEFVSLAAEGEEFGLATKGVLLLCKTAHGLDEEGEAASLARKLGLSAQVLDAKQAAAIDPGITMDILGAVYYPQDCHLRPASFIAVLEKRFRAAGGELRFGPAVTGWRRKGSRLDAVRTDEGDVEGDEFILAGGAWSAELLKPLGLRLPLQAGKGYSLTLLEPVERPTVSAICKEARVAVTPIGDGVRFGGTMEIAGFSEAINPRRVAGILKSVPQYYPRFRSEQFSEVKPWCGLRPCSPDGLPYVGRTRAAANLLVATGHAMMGLSLAPVTGRIVGRLVDDEPAGFEMGLLSPDRYA